MPETIRIIIAEDHTIVRSGLKMLLEAQEDIEVVAEAGDGQEALELVEKHQPDLVLLDIGMPKIDGMEATRQIKTKWPQIQVLALTMHRSDEYFFEMLKAGASGYILKGAETKDFIEAVRIVNNGDMFITPTMARKLVQDYVSRSDNTDDNRLSPRENEILRLLADGYSNNEIAEKLVISTSTVYTHRNNIMTKLGLNSRRELMQYARDKGII